MTAQRGPPPAAATRMPVALATIEDEHRTLAAVLHGLRFLVEEIRKGRMQPDFELFRAMVYYVDAYPERLHHPKEEDFLFRCLRARTSEADALLDELKAEHAAGEGAIRDLEKKLLAYEFGNRFESFATAADAYVAAYFGHMRKEETQVLPLALKWLTAADWSEVDAAFAANGNPMADAAEPSFRSLFSRIVNLAPPPIGVGPLFPPRR